MIKKIFFILIFGLISSSCNDNNELIGHWHEYTIGESEFNNCYIITDSTFAIDQFTMGSSFKKSELENPEIWTLTPYTEELILSRKVKENKILFGDSLVWKRQENNLETFISDFSAGYKLKVNPFSSSKETFDLIEPIDGKTNIHLVIGSVKEKFINESNGIIRGQYYFQINDIITDKEEDLLDYVLCTHCDNRKINVFVNADKNTPKYLIDKFEDGMAKIGVTKNQIYYLTINTNKQISGYNHYH